VEALEALDDLAASIDELEKGGSSKQSIEEEAEAFEAKMRDGRLARAIEQCKRMRQWVLDAENILDGIGRK